MTGNVAAVLSVIGLDDKISKSSRNRADCRFFKTCICWTLEVVGVEPARKKNITVLIINIGFQHLASSTRHRDSQLTCFVMPAVDHYTGTACRFTSSRIRLPANSTPYTACFCLAFVVIHARTRSVDTPKPANTELIAAIGRHRIVRRRETVQNCDFTNVCSSMFAPYPRAVLAPGLARPEPGPYPNCRRH